MSVAILKYLKESNLDKLNIMAYSPPYLGTILASPVMLYEKCDEIIKKVKSSTIEKIIPHLANIKPKTKEKRIEGNSLVDILKKIHWNVFSQSHMDYDI